MSGTQLRIAVCISILLLVGSISDESLRVIEQKEEIVRRLAASTAELHRTRAFAVANCECSVHSCAFEFPGAKCYDILGGLPSLCGEECDGQLIDFNSTIVRMPPGTDPNDMDASLKESICTYKGLEPLFFSLYPDAYAWTYIGTFDGHFRRWPAAGRDHDKNNENGEPLLHWCSPYDARTRPWYIAASTGPKDIVFVIDKSGSMLDDQIGDRPLKWNTTTKAVLAMIDTLSPNDFFNVVTFSDSAEQLWQEETLLARGTTENKDMIKAALTNQVPEGGTNFDSAFQVAFDLLINACDVERQTCSKCEKVIIFLTDGKDTSRSLDGGIKPSEMATKIEAYQEHLMGASDRRASIFTFSMGTDADDSIPRQIACNNDGSWSFIRATDDPLTAMRSYYLFLTARRSSGSPIWTEPYEDASGLGQITTVAMPIFSVGTGDLPGVFLGVAGHDVFFHELAESDSEQTEILNELIERGAKCDPLITDVCQLQVLRNVYANAATCIDRFPMKPTPLLENEQPRCFTNGRSFYKHFSSMVNWDEARDLCEQDEGSLVSIGTEDELSFVANMASDDGTWVGAKREFDTFSWLDTTAPDITQGSEFWGIGQPSSYQGVEDCVCVDTRGPAGNLNDVRCDDSYSFICEYTTNKSCKGEILNPREEDNEYFTVPPVELCVNAEASLSRAGSIPAAENLNEADVLCPLGESRPDFEFRCCEQCVLSKRENEVPSDMEESGNEQGNSEEIVPESQQAVNNMVHINSAEGSGSQESSGDSGTSRKSLVFIMVGTVLGYAIAT